MNRLFGFIFYGLLSFGVYYAASYQFVGLPNFAKLLSPFDAIAAATDNRADSLITVPKTGNKIKVSYNKYAIPLISANSAYDLYFVQGYVTAQHRLWQMDIQTKAAAGELSEILGEKTLEYDKYQRKIGMGYAAKNALTAMLADNNTKTALLAYTDGVNAYINHLKPSEWPIEYSVLNHSPEIWSPLRTAYLLKSMAYTLTGHNDDYAVTKTAQALGIDSAEKLFPYTPFRDSYIVPEGTKFDKVEIPVVPDVIFKAVIPTDDKGGPTPHPNNGSNNWVIAPNKSMSGGAMLCNDPHLTLSLPSLWFLAELKLNGKSVKGATLPGSPGVIIGANDSIAWGVTNNYADVFDWYALTLNAKTDQYLYNNQYRPFTYKTDTILVRGKLPVVIKTPYTLHGPVPYLLPSEKPFNNQTPNRCALRWVAHQPSNDLLAFLKINEAQNLAQFDGALSYYACPAQNFAYADARGNIAIRCAGKFPLKWKGQGKYILDGSRPDHLWDKYLTYNQIPKATNPERGYLFSANQTLADTAYPFYLNWYYRNADRALAIDRFLAVKTKLSVADLSNLQNDVTYAFAVDALPLMLEKISKIAKNSKQEQTVKLLSQWNGKMLPELWQPAFFLSWVEECKSVLWGKKLEPNEAFMPRNDLLYKYLVQIPDSSLIFDGNKTKKKESFAELLFIAFNNTIAKQTDSTGKFITYGKSNPSYINHIGKIPGFGLDPLELPGYGGTVNAQSGTHGPSFRWVVDFTNTGKPKLYFSLPGGQSGKVGTKNYTHLFESWKQGKLLEWD